MNRDKARPGNLRRCVIDESQCDGGTRYRVSTEIAPDAPATDVFPTELRPCPARLPPVPALSYC